MQPQKVLGQREKNKVEKVNRIRRAALDLFVEKGFDDATTREIAIRAGVGIGTVFTYADNKRDLLFLIANDDLDKMALEAGASYRETSSCLDNLVAFFRQHYKFYAQQPELSRILLREMTFYDTGRQAKRFQAIRERNIETLSRIVKLGIENGEFAAVEKPDFMGWIMFAVFQVELRQWLRSGSPSVPSGIRKLERALHLCMTGWDLKNAAQK